MLQEIILLCTLPRARIVAMEGEVTIRHFSSYSVYIMHNIISH